MAWVTWFRSFLEFLLLIAPVAYLGLNCLLLGECLFALIPAVRKRSSAPSSPSPSVTVLIPAHNEEQGLQKTLTRLLPEVSQPAHIIVIADNCDDATADIARQSGVTVLERTDAVLRGKGYALDHGLKALAGDPPDVVIMVDADCWVTPGTIKHIAQSAFQTKRPVQAVYLMEQPPEPSLRDRVSAFAWMVKNRVRAAGLSRLGAPFLLGGTGMAFPWQSLQSVDLASGHLVEDMKLGIDLAIAGYSPVLELNYQVIGVLPEDAAAATSQRTRWEHGHLQTLKTYVPRLWGEAIRQFRPSLFLLGLDLAIPPLALWSMVGIGLTLVMGVVAYFGMAVLPFQLQLVADGLLLSSILLSWIVWGRKIVAFSQLIAIPLYILWKIPIYLKALFKPETTWVRTKRNL